MKLRASQCNRGRLHWTDALPLARHLEGVQFRLESIMTEHGHAMLKNFLNR